MLVFFCCLDRPGAYARRRAARAEHLEYMIQNQDKLVFGGPVSAEPDKGGVGSVFVLDLPDLDAAWDFLAAEPYNRAGLFESVIVRPFRQMSPELEPGHLLRELERERAATTQRSA
ncbi:MAG: YciI family protein [Actinoallomurus sp.]